jgi:Cof subfamily protein (haloacid dehalogenase superfamily)
MATMAPKVVATDLDGTLLRSDGTLDERTRQALVEVEAAGALLVICTARPARWMAPLAAQTGHRGVAICANGGVLWDLHTDTALEEYPLAPAVAREVVAVLQEALPGGAWAVERADGFAREPAYHSVWPLPANAVVGAIEELVGQPSLKLLLRHRQMTADELLTRARELVGDRAELSHSNSSDNLLEIAAPGVSKATALTRLCEHRGFSSADVIAFGDMPNDLAMLQWAGHAVAVGNAHPDVIAVADEVTADNDSSGVALVLERLYGRGAEAPRGAAEAVDDAAEIRR